jgi:hypothetical protein
VSLFGVVTSTGKSNVYIMVWTEQQHFITTGGQHLELTNLRETCWMQLQFIAVTISL